jgi:hypothetical protein
MDIHQELSSLLSSSTWVKSPGEALRRVPALGQEMPALVRLPGKSSTRIPVAEMEELVETVVRTLVSASSRVLSGGMGERVDQLSEDALSGDPLVQLLEKQFSQLGWAGLRRDTVPLLSTCWVSSRMLGGRVGELQLRENALIRQSEKLVDRLQEMAPSARGEALAGLSWELTGRTGAALNMVLRAGRPLQAAGLARSLLPSRLLVAFPRGSLNAKLDLPVVSGVLGLGLNEEILSCLERIAGLALGAVQERIGSGKASGIDMALSQALDSRLAPEEPRIALLHSVAGPLLVASIPSLLNRRQLKAAGVKKSVLASLQDPVSMTALASTWQDLVAALAEWDVLSALVDRVSPITRKQDGWVYGNKALEDSVRWECLLPRQAPERPLIALAVRLSDIRENVEARARDTGRVSAAGVVESAWNRFCEETSCSVHDWVGDHGVALFDQPLDAIAFAREVSHAFSGPFELPIGARGGTVAIRSGLNVGVGLAFGRLVGGNDGSATCLQGPIIGRAMALSGTGMLEGAAEDAGGYRRAVNGRTGLRSEGIVMGPQFLEAYCESQEQQGTPIRGPVMPGDDGRGFEYFPVLCWWSSPGGVVVAMGLHDGSRGGSAAELIDMDDAAFEAFCDADRVAGRMKRGSRVREQAKWEGFGGEVVEQATDDIDAVFLGLTDEDSSGSEPPVFAPDPIAVVAREGPKSQWSEEIVGAPMLLEPSGAESEAQANEPVELPGPAVFIDDDWDSEGWDENSWEDEHWGEKSVDESPGTPPPSAAQLQASVAELTESYVVVRAAGCFYFGRLDGPSLRDALQCQTAGDTMAAYKALLLHHRRMWEEGGSRAQVMGVQEDWYPEPLDKTLLQKAISELKW